MREFFSPHELVDVFKGVERRDGTALAIFRLNQQKFATEPDHDHLISQTREDLHQKMTAEVRSIPDLLQRSEYRRGLKALSQ